MRHLSFNNANKVTRAILHESGGCSCTVTYFMVNNYLTKMEIFLMQNALV
jgi:hypothetical protein